MNWELYRQQNSNLDLVKVFEDLYSHKDWEWVRSGCYYITNVTALSSVKSRQVAALVIISAEAYADAKENL